jgi:hypothetical protein
MRLCAFPHSSRLEVTLTLSVPEPVLHYHQEKLREHLSRASEVAILKNIHQHATLELAYSAHFIQHYTYT